MKRVTTIALLATMLASAPAQLSTNAPPPLTEAVCGFIAGKSFYAETADVKRGLSVNLFVGDVQLGQPTKLKFYVNQVPGGAPVENLQVEHEKFIHVFGVRDDLGEFFHVHPLKASPGTWVATHIFTNGGNYKLWSDVKWRGASYCFGHPILSVPGSFGPLATHRAPTAIATNAGYRVTFEHPQPLRVGRTNLLAFTIRNDHGDVVETENFLGAPMHLVLVRDDLSALIHAHPEARIATESAITFRQGFTQLGTYKLFAQFRPRKANLPPDDAILVEFYANVLPAD